MIHLAETSKEGYGSKKGRLANDDDVLQRGTKTWRGQC
jgi:hypothetical protein